MELTGADLRVWGSPSLKAVDENPVSLEHILLSSGCGCKRKNLQTEDNGLGEAGPITTDMVDIIVLVI